MKASDIVSILAARVPLYTSAFSDAISVLSATVVSDIVTVQTNGPHGLQENQNVALIGMEAPVQVDVGSFLRTGATATFDTLQDHDFTLSERDKVNGGKTLTISNANEVEFNGTFQIVRVINRRQLQIAVDDSGPTTISGAPLVDNANGGLFNGLFPAVNVGIDTFEYQIPQAYPLDPVFAGAEVQVNIRILSVLDIQQYLMDVYTKQEISDNQLVVQLGDVTQSKNRDEITDASTSTVGGYSFTPYLIQSFSIYIVQNSTQSLAASELRDLVESEYVPAIFRSVLREEFNSNFTYSQYRTTFVGHGVFAYANEDGKNKAIYVHEVTFQQLSQLCREDMVGADPNVAMRDVEYSLTTNIGTGELLADIDLDEEPIV